MMTRENISIGFSFQDKSTNIIFIITSFSTSYNREYYRVYCKTHIMINNNYSMEVLLQSINSGRFKIIKNNSLINIIL